MKLGTERLILRHWEESDAENLYEYAKDPDVGPIAGWPAHQSIEESLDVIKNVFNTKEAYAICLKTDNKAIGAIELKLNGHTDMTNRDDECELGYWLGKPFWGQGIMPEAAKEMIRHAFEDIGMTKIWVGYYEGNTKSKRVQEKTGFRYQWKSENVDVPLMHEKRTGHVSSLTKDQWQWDSDTCCTLGICAERNAIFNMITNGEHEIKKVIAILPDGSNGAPCGACRELMVQLMPEKYKDIEIMMDYKQERIMTLGELTPEWWI